MSGAAGRLPTALNADILFFEKQETLCGDRVEKEARMTFLDLHRKKGHAAGRTSQPEDVNQFTQTTSLMCGFLGSRGNRTGPLIRHSLALLNLLKANHKNAVLAFEYSRLLLQLADDDEVLAKLVAHSAPKVFALAMESRLHADEQASAEWGGAGPADLGPPIHSNCCQLLAAMASTCKASSAVARDCLAVLLRLCSRHHADTLEDVFQVLHELAERFDSFEVLLGVKDQLLGVLQSGQYSSSHQIRLVAALQGTLRKGLHVAKEAADVPLPFESSSGDAGAAVQRAALLRQHVQARQQQQQHDLEQVFALLDEEVTDAADACATAPPVFVVADTRIAEGRPDYYTSIAEAVKAARVNAVINIAAGEFHEDVVVDKPLTLRGKGSSTVLRPVVGPTGRAALRGGADGRGDAGAEDPHAPGGAAVLQGSPILRHCRLTDLKVLSSTPLVLDCTVRLLAVEGAAGGVYYRNVLQSPAPLHVPAVRAASSGHPCFMGNSVTGEGAPAAVEVTGPTTTCRWRFNTFADTAVAFGVAEGARPECEANHFRGARVAAIHCQTGGGGTFTRNCISEAEVGVHTQSRADPTFVHNLLFDCSGPARTRTACAVRVDAAGAGRFLRNALWDNAHAAAIVATDGAPRLRDNSVLLSTKPRGTNVDAQGIVVQDGGKGELIGNEVYGIGTAGVSIAGGARPNVLRNHVHGCWAAAVRVSDGGGGVLKQNVIARTPRGVVLLSKADPMLDGNTITGATDAGVHAADGALGRLQHNSIVENKTNVVVAAGAAPVLEHNTISRSSSAGVHVHSGGLGTFRANDIADHPTAGVLVEDGGQGQFDSNRIHDNPRTGVLMRNGMAEFHKNVIIDSDVGVLCSAQSHGLFSMNFIRNHREHGLKVEGRSRTRFQRNTIAHVPHAAVLLAAQACPVLTDNDIGFCQGPAVHCTEQSTGSFAGNTIHDHRGPGFLVDDSCPEIRGCTISEGASEAVLYRNKGQGALTKCQILKHKGTCVAVTDQSNPVIMDNVISDGAGDGIVVSESRAQIQRNQLFRLVGFGLRLHDKGISNFAHCEVGSARVCLSIAEGCGGKFEGLNLHDAEEVLMSLHTSEYLEFRDCTFHRSAQDGVMVHNGAPQFFDNEFKENAGVACKILVDAKPGPLLSNNAFTGNAVAIQCTHYRAEYQTGNAFAANRQAIRVADKAAPGEGRAPSPDEECGARDTDGEMDAASAVFAIRTGSFKKVKRGNAASSPSRKMGFGGGGWHSRRRQEAFEYGAAGHVLDWRGLQGPGATDVRSLNRE
eukprot:CAMPEP_0174311046 /NCGR_PEP_ID=MMETSP0810-20121108/3463_1 /TAXON_ID=73025 ORGANISM="Eutreptiella gymnastica-like, Strain CCMP1594" /NCGR_SAMPLE_ID=MMETSP0810 /ASSEMBLY_ACC=CAM_ASM_000659 /LENGTH=1281 /DNA_ID=CAMNT_0015419177 /DNA_START=118 /DNA_END=3964 /DNA_ORIENTATION=-